MNKKGRVNPALFVALSRYFIYAAAIPTLTISDGGDTLLVHDPKAGTLLCFDLPKE
jgi:hypothetical protein